MDLEICTLVDITKTNITRNFKSQGSSLTQEQWDFLRNQQRNWDVVVQLLGLRFQPSNISNPIKMQNLNYEFGEEYVNKDLIIWKFDVEFDHDIPLNLLCDDFNNIPIILGLEESVNIFSPMFSTYGIFKNILINR